jgi:septum formation protein
LSLWRGEPIVLASKSEVRRKLLQAAAIPVVVDPADVDERAIEANSASAKIDPEVAALVLAREKALAVGRRRAGIVLGADQTLALGARRFSKPDSRAAARDQLSALAGRTHSLHSAAALVRKDRVLFETVSTARLTMRALSDAALDAYLDSVGELATTSVGAYQLEGLGVHLFDEIEGDHFTVLGLPLLPLLAHFRKVGLLQ